jgi:hypothetical protein
VARAPAGQIADHDRVETTGQRWVTAADALARDDHPVIYPTYRTLKELATFSSLDALLADAGSRSDIRSVQPHLVVDDQGQPVRILHPDDDEYPHQLYGPGRQLGAPR